MGSGEQLQWDSDTCFAAAEGGHLGVLQWLRQNGCECDSDTCWAAAESGHLGVLQWARKNGCEWERVKCFDLARAHPGIRAWISSLD